MKTKTVNDIHELIKQKAELRLNNEISAFVSFIREHKLFRPIEELQIEADGQKQSLRIFFWGHGYDAANKIKEALLQEYINEESKAFFDKVNELVDYTENI